MASLSESSARPENAQHLSPSTISDSRLHFPPGMESQIDPSSDSKYAEELQVEEVQIASLNPSYMSTPNLLAVQSPIPQPPDDSVILVDDVSGSIPDSKYAEELQLQETLISDSQRANPEPLAVRSPAIPTPVPQETVITGALITIDEESGEASQVFCEICADKKDADQMFKAKSCAHSICGGCISNHVSVRLRDGATAITCPGLACSAALDPISCRGAVPPEVLSRWETALCEALIAESQKFYCPFRDCSALLVDDGEGGVIRESECPICRRLFCAQCYVPWHSGVGCEEFSRLGQHERGREDLMVREMARNASWNRCPHCKFYVEKTEGCLHINCRCGYQFCYGCGSQWSSSHGGCQPMLRN